MKNKLLILAMLGIFSANFMHSDEVEEVVVQASLLNVTEDEIGDPLHILSGSDISDLGTVSLGEACLLYTSPSPRDKTPSRIPSSA